MTICDICSGFHSMSDCLTARRHLEACVILGTPDDYTRPNNVVELITELTYAKQTASDIERKRARWHWSSKHNDDASRTFTLIA